jgi:hypothetical protein
VGGDAGFGRGGGGVGSGHGGARGSEGRAVGYSMNCIFQKENVGVIVFGGKSGDVVCYTHWRDSTRRRVSVAATQPPLAQGPRLVYFY